MKTITVAVDAMGGDHGPRVIIPAALRALAKQDALQLILVGDEKILQKELHGKEHARLTIHHASQSVEMNESPAVALRTKKDSSMRVAINLVKEGKAQACVSAGNTGALMATARFVLKTVPGIDRPAIISTFPTRAGNNMRMLDLGANVDCSIEHLFQFAVMGSVLAHAVDNIENPTVCLLNIGEEDIKGNEQVKEAAQLFANSTAINYQGYIEGDKLYSGQADVIVCDGFVGNVALKASEGVASFIQYLIKEAFLRNFFTKCVALLALPVLKSLIKRTDPDRYNGASLIGLRGIVIKSHGGAKVRAFTHAIEEAMIQVDKDISTLIHAKVEQLLKVNPSENPTSEG